MIAHLCCSHWFFSYLRWPNCKYHADGPDVLVDAAASAFGAQTHVVFAPSMMDGLKADPSRSGCNFACGEVCMWKAMDLTADEEEEIKVGQHQIDACERVSCCARGEVSRAEGSSV